MPVPRPGPRSARAQMADSRSVGREWRRARLRRLSTPCRSAGKNFRFSGGARVLSSPDLYGARQSLASPPGKSGNKPRCCQRILGWLASSNSGFNSVQTAHDSTPTISSPEMDRDSDRDGGVVVRGWRRAGRDNFCRVGRFQLGQGPRVLVLSPSAVTGASSRAKQTLGPAADGSFYPGRPGATSACALA